MSVRLIIADDHPIVRAGIRNALGLSPDIKVIGEAVNGDDAFEQCRQLTPDILLLDINMPGLKALNLVRNLRKKQQVTRVIVLTGYRDPENVLGMLQLGVKGYLLKDEEPDVLVEAILAVSRGQSRISPGVLEELSGQGDEEKQVDLIEELTPRELEILQLIAQGIDNQAIAQNLSIAEGTVKNHMINIYDKLRLHSRAEVVAWVWRHKLA